METGKPLTKDSADWICHADDLIPLSEVDQFTSNVASQVASLLVRVSSFYFTLDHHNNLLLRQDSVVSKIRQCGSRPSIDIPNVRHSGSKYVTSKRTSTRIQVTIVSLSVGILVIPVFLLLWIPMSRFWKSATVAFSMLVFATLMSSLTRVRTQDVLMGTAA
jgi:hypothetical protein